MRRFLSMSFFKTYIGWLLLPFLGLLFGGLASTANPLVIGLGVSSFIGIILIKKPILNVDVLIILGLAVTGVVVLSFGNLAAKMVWGVSILGFMVLVSALYRLITVSSVRKDTPVFVWVALCFMAYALIDSILQFYSVKDLFAGFKRYFQVWGLLFALCWMGFGTKEIERWCKFVLIICLLQAPFCLYQSLVLVPIREGYVDSIPGLVPIDVVAGTFGGEMLGGSNNAEMATALVMVFAFFLSRYKVKLMTNKELYVLSLLLLSPLAMGETKIIVIFFPIMFFALYYREFITRPHYGLAVFIVGGILTAVALNVYAMMNKMTLDNMIFDTLKYNVYEVGYGNCVLNRTSVVIFWWTHNSAADPISFLFGHGLGSAHPADSSSPGGYIDSFYPGFCVGLTGTSKVLWELGIVGFCWFLIIMLMTWICANKVIKVASDVKIRADAAAIKACIALFGLYPFYGETLFSAVPFQVFFVCILGYLAWMYKQSVGNKS